MDSDIQIFEGYIDQLDEMISDFKARGIALKSQAESLRDDIQDILDPAGGE